MSDNNIDNNNAYNPYAAPNQNVYQQAPNAYQQTTQNVYQQPVVQQPVYTQPEPVSKSGAIVSLVFGILSLMFSELGLLGLIFAIVSKVNRKKFISANGSDIGLSKGGNITSTIGLIFSILSMVFWVVYFIVLIVVFVSGAGYVASSAGMDFFDLIEDIFYELGF